MENNTVLTDENIENLKRVFKDDATFVKYMKVLYATRRMSERACKNGNIHNDTVNVDSPYFALFQLTNDLIGALFIGHPYSFDVYNGIVSAYDIKNQKPI